jgi:hypothetical protein
MSLDQLFKRVTNESNTFQDPFYKFYIEANELFSTQRYLGFCDKIELSYHFLWNTTFFFCVFYIILVFSTTVYILPEILACAATTSFKNNLKYIHIKAETMRRFLILPVISIFFITFVWTSPVINTWFGQLTISAFQRAISLFVAVIFTLTIYVYTTYLIFNTKEVYDFIITIFNVFLWILFIFYANNIFTVVFFIEILTGLTVLLFITSIHSSTYTFNTSSFSKSLYFNQLAPRATLDVLIFFFWMSLLSSLFLFIFLIFFYIHVPTFEFSLTEILLNHMFHTYLFKQFFTIIFVTFLLLMIIFLKCGLVPLYVWKPIVFKGMTLGAIFFYIFFYYFFLLLFFIYLLTANYADIICYNKINLTLALLMGLFTLLFILIESYYLKAFLAMSSILNTLLIFIGLTSLSISGSFFIL